MAVPRGVMHVHPLRQSTDQTPAPGVRSWRQRNSYLFSLLLGLVPAVIMLVFLAVHDSVMNASNGEPRGSALTIDIVVNLGGLILYVLVVLAALTSLVVPYLRRRYAGGLWMAVLLIPLIMYVAFMTVGYAIGGD